MVVGTEPVPIPQSTACARLAAPILRYAARMCDFTVLGLRNVRAAISALFLPWVISAEHLGLAVSEPLGTPRPVQPQGTARARRRVADDELAGVDRLEGLDQVVRAQRLGQVAVHPQLDRTLDQVGMEVPGVDDDLACPRVVDQDGDLVLVGLGLGERVVQDDVDAWPTGVLASISATTTRSV